MKYTVAFFLIANLFSHLANASIPTELDPEKQIPSKDPSLSYLIHLAGICRGGGADPDACEKWIRSPQYKALLRRQEREDALQCPPDKPKMGSMFGVFCYGDGSKAFRQFYRWDREQRRRDAYCGPHKSVVDYGNGKWGCEPTG